MVAALLAVALVPAGARVTDAAPPAPGYPTLEFQSMIITQPVKGSTTTLGDAEGLAEDPLRHTIWVVDDTNHALYEIDLADGTLRSTITRAQLAASLQFQPGGQPFGPAAGDSRPIDMEGLAYDDVHDQLFVFAGPCCPVAPHEPTVFRLTRPAAGAAFLPESFQPLLDPVYNDFSGAAARNGVLWAGQGKVLSSYDYVTNTITSHTAPLPISGVWIYGLDFSADGNEAWVTDSADRLYRIAFPSLALIPNHSLSTRDFDIDDPRAVEVVGDQVVVADGDDQVSSGSSRRFALHVFAIGHSAPTASFTTDVVTGTAPLDVTFTDTSGRRPNSWSWRFGDGTSTSSHNPTHQFVSPGLYTVTLTASNPNGSSTATTTIIVNPGGPADFATTTGPGVREVTFTDQTVPPDPLVPVTTWFWSFGDGTSSVAGPQTARTYDAAGEYFVELQVTMADLSTYRVTRRVIVAGPPTAAFDADVLSGKPPLDVTFIDRSTGSPTPTKWRWEFGDGTKSSLRHPFHTFTAAGTYTVKLTVTNADGSATTTRTVVVRSGPVTSFNAGPSSGPAPLDVTFTNTTTSDPAATSYRWTFGDGSPAVTTMTPTLSHRFASPGSYTVTLAATNSVGTVTASRTVTAEGPPTTSFTSDRTTVVAPGSVAFTDTSVGTPPPSGWLWDFGDGTPTSTARHPTHAFTRAGTFTVVLTATNGRGSSSNTMSITVTTAPQALFIGSPAAGTAPLSVSFTDTSVGSPTAWRWDFGDGSPISTQRNPLHVYDSVGTFTVVLTATLPGGARTSSQSVTVMAADAGFVGLTPTRLLDSRPGGTTIDGLFAGTGRLGEDSLLDLDVGGRGGVPLAGVGAVALNVTAVGPTDESYLTVWPSGVARPTASNLNFGSGRTVPNMVVVALGAQGRVTLFNATGSAHVLVDVLGWFPTGSSFGGLTPARLMDTRGPGLTVDGLSSGGGPFPPGATARLPVVGRGGVPGAGVGSVVLNVTAVGATTESFLTVWPTGVARPNASNLNFPASRTVANLVIVPAGADGAVSVFNAAGGVDVLVDVLGWIPAGPLYTGLAPTRLMDTRGPGLTIDGEASGGGPLGPAGTVRLAVRGRGGVPSAGAGSVALNVTAVAATAESFLTVWPSDGVRPNASNLNLEQGATVANTVIVPLAADGSIALYNDEGSTGLLVDVLGWFP